MRDPFDNEDGDAGPNEDGPPLLKRERGIVHESPRGNWQTVEVLPEDGCTHEASDRWAKDHKMAGNTAHCPDCGASRGNDGVWRKIVDA